MKIVNMPTVDWEELEKTFDISVFDCDFAQEAENGSYVVLDLDLAHVDDLKEELNWQEAKGEGDSRYARGLRSELKIIQGLREIGYNQEILVYISW